MKEGKMITKTEVSILKSGECPICKTKVLYRVYPWKNYGSIYCSKGHRFLRSWDSFKYMGCTPFANVAA